MSQPIINAIVILTLLAGALLMFLAFALLARRTNMTKYQITFFVLLMLLGGFLILGDWLYSDIPLSVFFREFGGGIGANLIGTGIVIIFWEMIKGL